MKKLTIVASNRNRLNLKENSTKFFIKSLQNQTCQDFEVLIADGGSNNFNELKNYFNSLNNFNIIQEIIGEKFERAKLNNVGIRNSKTEYVMTTDVDMFFAPHFVYKLLNNVGKNIFIECRTMYWKDKFVNKIYSGEIDPFSNIEKCYTGRLKQRTTAGGCQCCHIDLWNKVRGFDEDFIGWGSEDFDLLNRMIRAEANVFWLGEDNDIILFHQPHKKENIVEDLKDQDKNKVLLRANMNYIRPFIANPKEWGCKP